MMRITNKMMVNSALFNMQKNLRRTSELLEQLETTRKLNRASDNPADFVKSMRLRANIVENTQYVRNMKDGIGFLDTLDSALDDATSIIQRLRELIVYAGTDTNGPLERSAIKQEVAQLREHMIVVANSNYGGKYIFAGTNVTERPYTDGELWKGNRDDLLIEIGVGVTFAVNVDMSTFFGNPTKTDGGGFDDKGIFGFMWRLEDFLTKLNENVPPNMSPRNLNADEIRHSLDELDGKIKELLMERATIGAKSNRLEMQMERMLDMGVEYTELLSQAEDADIAEVITWLNMQESVYKASLAMTARVIQPTLIDFLR